MFSFTETAQEKRPINEPQTRIPAAPDLPPAPASWAVPANENITWPRFWDENPKRRGEFQNPIQIESKFIHFNVNIGSNNTFSNVVVVVW